jgi:MFS family permease
MRAGWRGRLTGRVGGAARAFALTAASPSLARAQLAFGAAWAAEWAFTVALGIVAFEDGGTGRVGLVAALRLVPSALLVPVLATLADRHRRAHVLVWTTAARAVATGAAGLLLAVDGPIVAVYALAVVSTIAITPYRAVHSALLPSLCRTTEELASSNVVRGMLDSASVVLGPFAAAVLIGATELWTVFVVAAATAAVSALLLVRLPYDPAPEMEGRGAPPSPVRAVREGLRATTADRNVLTLTSMAMTQTFLRGCLTVFTVVVAIELLETGESGAGVLQGAMGVGGIAGSLGSALLVGSRRMGRWFAVSVALWGLPFCVVGVLPNRGVALAMLGAVGIANALLDVALFTSMSRLVPNEVLARVFGVFESAVAATVALGAVVAAAAVEWLGVRDALVVLGASGPLTAAAGWMRLSRIDAHLSARTDEIDVLQRVPMLRMLPVTTIERLAGGVIRKHVAPGGVVFRKGSLGARYFVVVDGEVEVLDGDRLLGRMGPGEGFGEIALLRDARRSATVRATDDGPVDLYAITRGDFVAAVVGVEGASSIASATIDERLAASRAARTAAP